MPLAGGGTVSGGKGSGDSSWYEGAKIAYTQRIKGAETGSISLVNPGHTGCAGLISYSSELQQSIAGDGASVNEPWTAKFTPPETYTGTAVLSITCWRDDYYVGPTHVWNLPIEVDRADPWTITVNTTSLWAGHEVSFAFTVNDHFVTFGGGCSLTITPPGQAPTTISNLYWSPNREMSFGEMGSPMDGRPWPTLSSPGTLRYTITCTDEQSVSQSASGTVQVLTPAAPGSPQPTAPPATPQPTDPPSDAPIASVGP